MRHTVTFQNDDGTHVTLDVEDLIEGAILAVQPFVRHGVFLAPPARTLVAVAFKLPERTGIAICRELGLAPEDSSEIERCPKCRHLIQCATRTCFRCGQPGGKR